MRARGILRASHERAKHETCMARKWRMAVTSSIMHQAMAWRCSERSNDERGRWSSYLYCRIFVSKWGASNTVTNKSKTQKGARPHGDDKDCTLMPWHMSVKRGVILYTRRRNAVSWRSSRVNKSLELVGVPSRSSVLHVHSNLSLAIEISDPRIW